MDKHDAARRGPTLARMAIVLLAAGPLLAGCSGKAAKLGDTLANAEAAVARAERARIADYDAESWAAARAHLAQARAAAIEVNSLESPVARWYAARAKVDAELGMVRAERSRLTALNAAMAREITALGGTPPPPALAPAAPLSDTAIEPAVQP